MAISEMKMQMVIDNYFKRECDTNTSIRQAFEKGFRIGAEKGASMNRPQGWIPCEEELPEYFEPVITWDGNCYFVEKRIPYIRDEDDNQIKSEWWVSDDYDEEETDYYPNLRDGAAIEWMPLPEQYEEERNDNENN